MTAEELEALENEADAEARKILCIVAWYSPEHGRWIASATTVQGIIGTGATFSAAVQHLETCLTENGYVQHTAS